MAIDPQDQEHAHPQGLVASLDGGPLAFVGRRGLGVVVFPFAFGHGRFPRWRMRARPRVAASISRAAMAAALRSAKA